MVSPRDISFVVLLVLLTCLLSCGGKKEETPPEETRAERVDEGAEGKRKIRENASVVKLRIPFRTEPSEDAPTGEDRSAVFYGTYLDIIDVEGDDWLEVRHRATSVGY